MWWCLTFSCILCGKMLFWFLWVSNIGTCRTNKLDYITSCTAWTHRIRLYYQRFHHVDKCALLTRRVHWLSVETCIFIDLMRDNWQSFELQCFVVCAIRQFICVCLCINRRALFARAPAESSQTMFVNVNDVKYVEFKILSLKSETTRAEVGAAPCVLCCVAHRANSFAAKYPRLSALLKQWHLSVFLCLFCCTVLRLKIFSCDDVNWLPGWWCNLCFLAVIRWPSSIPCWTSLPPSADVCIYV